MAMVPMEISTSGLNTFWDLLRSSRNMIGYSVTYLTYSPFVGQGLA